MPNLICLFILCIYFREAKLLLEKLGSLEESSVVDAMDACCPLLSEHCLPLLPPVEKQAVAAAAQLDLQWFCDRTHTVWTPGVCFK